MDKLTLKLVIINLVLTDNKGKEDTNDIISK